MCCSFQSSQCMSHKKRGATCFPSPNTYAFEVCQCQGTIAVGDDNVLPLQKYVIHQQFVLTFRIRLTGSHPRLSTRDDYGSTTVPRSSILDWRPLSRWRRAKQVVECCSQFTLPLVIHNMSVSSPQPIESPRFSVGIEAWIYTKEIP